VTKDATTKRVFVVEIKNSFPRNREDAKALFLAYPQGSRLVVDASNIRAAAPSYVDELVKQGRATSDGVYFFAPPARTAKLLRRARQARRADSKVFIYNDLEELQKAVGEKIDMSAVKTMHVRRTAPAHSAV
jgi:hypothetical protein